MGLGRWLCRWGKRIKLFGQNQFAVAGDAQAVFVVMVIDQDFVLCPEQFAAADPAPLRNGFLFDNHDALTVDVPIVLVIHKGRMVSDKQAAARVVRVIARRLFANVPAIADTTHGCPRPAPAADAPATGLVDARSNEPVSGNGGR